MKRLCDCGKILHKGTRGDKCIKCSRKSRLRAGSALPDCPYLVDVPRMTDDEYDIIEAANNNGHRPTGPTIEADAIIKRNTARVRRAKRKHGILN